MIYVSIDNDQHGDLALCLFKRLGVSESDVTFISHKSVRNKIIPASKYAQLIINGHPLSGGSGYKRLLSYVNAFKNQKKLNAKFRFTANDTLVLMTEHQLNNALLARNMKQAGGKVYLFDEGIGFYFNNSPYHEMHTKLIDKLFLALYNLAFFVLGLPAYARKGFEGRMYVCIKDEFIDRIYSRMRLSINRPAEIYGYKNFLVDNQKENIKYKDVAIFFANNLSCFNLKYEELELSRVAIAKMVVVFREVIIKLHPTDALLKNDVFAFYKELAGQYTNVYLLDNSLLGNEALQKFKPKIVVGMLGTAMFDALFFGCEPVFLFHFLPQVPEFEVCNLTLKKMNYHFINSMEEIAPNFHCRVDVDSLTYEQDSFSDWSFAREKTIKSSG